MSTLVVRNKATGHKRFYWWDSHNTWFSKTGVRSFRWHGHRDEGR